MLGAIIILGHFLKGYRGGEGNERLILVVDGLTHMLAATLLIHGLLKGDVLSFGVFLFKETLNGFLTTDKEIFSKVEGCLLKTIGRSMSNFRGRGVPLRRGISLDVMTVLPPFCWEKTVNATVKKTFREAM